MEGVLFMEQTVSLNLNKQKGKGIVDRVLRPCCNWGNVINERTIQRRVVP